jgi:DNA-directed RNA polymerase specialized sigma subunit
MKEIGGILGVNESRISQMHRYALTKMAANLTDKGICLQMLGV